MNHSSKMNMRGDPKVYEVLQQLNIPFELWKFLKVHFKIKPSLVKMNQAVTGYLLLKVYGLFTRNSIMIQQLKYLSTIHL